ncbi:MAG: TolC family protein [Flavobacteriales bacterium]
MKKLTLLFFTSILTVSSYAQDSLFLDQAIEMAIVNNYNVQVVKLSRDASVINNTAGAAGMTPNVNLNVGDQYTSNNLLQRFANGQEITSPNASGNSFTTNLTASWVIFDGLKMFATKDRLEQQEKNGELTFTKQISATINEVTQAFSLLQQLQLKRDYITTLIAFNELRVDLSNTRWQAGTGAKTDFLQASIDLNASRAQFLSTNNEIEAASTNLKNIIGIKGSDELLVSQVIIAQENDVTQLKEKIKSENLDLAIANTQLEISRLQVKEAKASFLPTVTLNGAYNFSRADNSAGFSLFNRTYGPAAGVTLSLPLYQSGQISRNNQLAQINFRQTELILDQMILETNAKAELLFTQVNNLMELNKLYQMNRDYSYELLDLALERYKQGQSSNLEVQQAQVAFNEANNAFLENNYQLQIAISEMKFMAGEVN